MVGVTYTGTNGQSVSFKSNSAADAMERLSRIPGYSASESDRIAAGLAKGWRERHKERAKKFASRMPFVGTPGGPKYSSGSGTVSGLTSVSDVRIDNGKIVKTSRQHFVSSGGETIGVGPKRTETVLDTNDLGLDKDDISIKGGADSNIKVKRNGNVFTVDVYYV